MGSSPIFLAKFSYPSACCLASSPAPPLLLVQITRVLNTLLRSKVVAVYNSVVTLVNSCRTCVLYDCMEMKLSFRSQVHPSLSTSHNQSGNGFQYPAQKQLGYSLSPACHSGISILKPMNTVTCTQLQSVHD